MSAPIDKEALKSLVAAHGLSAVIGTPAGLESAAARLGEFFSCYREHRGRHGSAASLPAAQDWSSLVHQDRTNPHRVQVLLQALAFVCSPEMLAMLWMVQLGASVKAIHVDHERENVTKLSVLLDLPGAEEATEEFKSTEHWDLALLQFAALTKVDEQPVISGFVALTIPRP